MEGEQAQIKDVPSLERKFSSPSTLKRCLKGRKRGRQAESRVCAGVGEDLAPPVAQADRRGPGMPGIFRTVLTTWCHMLAVCA